MLVKVIVTTVLDPRMYTPPPCQIGQRNVDFHIRNLHWGVVVGPLFETGVCAHIWSLIVVDGAIIDVHSASHNGNASTL